MPYLGQSLTEGTRRAYTFVATSGQTTFNAVYGVGAVDVYQNGILLQPSDYNSSSGSSVVLGVGAAVNDEITIIAHNTFSVADTVSSSQGGTFAGNVSMSGTLGVTGAVTTSGNLLVGTTTEGHSQADNLTVSGSGHTGITIRSTDSNETAIFFSDATSGTGEYIGAINYIHSDNSMRFASNVSERMRITDDKVQFNVDAKVNADNSHDLGSGGARWKDLYLSGGLYVGGTGAANKLSDYEYGTWAATLNSGVGITVNNGGQPAANAYTKIGRLVYLTFDFTVGTTSSTAHFTVDGSSMPFTPINYTEGTIGWSDYNTTNLPNILVVSGGFNFYHNGNIQVAFSSVSGKRFIGSVTYTVA